MPDFSRVINQAYMRILERPADAGGLEAYNGLMNAGMSESQMRESLLRSQEYARKNPSDAGALARSGARKSSSRKKAKKAGKSTKKKAARKSASRR